MMEELTWWVFGMGTKVLMVDEMIDIDFPGRSGSSIYLLFVSRAELLHPRSETVPDG